MKYMIHVCHKITLSLILSAAVLSHTIKGCEDVKLGEGFFGMCLKLSGFRESDLCLPARRSTDPPSDQKPPPEWTGSTSDSDPCRPALETHRESG